MNECLNMKIFDFSLRSPVQSEVTREKFYLATIPISFLKSLVALIEISLLNTTMSNK